jgi:hypothetical protein
MKEFNREEFNVICAEFMGGVKEVIPEGGLSGYKEGTVLWSYLFSSHKDPVTYLEFDTDWNWIMPVIEKIESLDESETHYQWEHIDGSTISNFVNYEVDIERNECRIWMNLELDPPDLVAKGEMGNKKESTVHAIWEFLNWYNEKNKNL